MFETQVSAAKLIRAHKDDILRLWEQRVRAELPAVEPHPSRIVLDALPEFLDEMAETLDHKSPPATTICTEHGEQRAGLSRFDFNTLFREFNILRETIFSVLEANEPQISQNDRDTILNMFFVGFRDSGAAF